MNRASHHAVPTTLFEQNYLHELSMAADFQRTVLPEIIKVDYLDIAIRYEPVELVSGDVYDFKLNRERELAIFIGDATGHGVAAALLTMMMHIAIDTLAPHLPTDISMRKLNGLIASRHTHRSVSGAFFRVTPDGMLTVTHAGHPSIIVLPHNGAAAVQFQQAGCPLGMFVEEPVCYLEERYQLQAGDKIFAYTDGLTEWCNGQRQAFGLVQLLSYLQTHREQDTQQLATTVYEHARQFVGNVKNSDDLTLLVAEYKPADPSDNKR